MQENNVKDLIFSSSATVYGSQSIPRLTEKMTTGLGITNPYGQTKFMIERIIESICESDKDFSATILRYFNPIGAHQSGLLGEDPNDIPNNLMPIIMKVYRGEICELSIYGDDYDTPDGTCIRDYIHVVDLAKGHLAAIEKIKKGCSIYNLGTGKGTSVKEIIRAFEVASKKDLPCKISPRRQGDLAEIYADHSLANKDLNWKTRLDINDAMKDTLNYLNNLE